MSNEKWTLGMRGHVLLTKSPNWFGERKREGNGKRERDLSRERISHFSLSFPTIGLVFGSGARGRVDTHSESFALRPMLWSLDKLRKIGVFLLLVLLFV